MARRESGEDGTQSVVVEVVIREGGVRDTTAWEGNDKRLGIGGQLRLRHGNLTA